MRGMPVMSGKRRVGSLQVWRSGGQPMADQRSLLPEKGKKILACTYVNDF